MATTQVAPLPADKIAEREARRSSIDSALGTTLAEGVSPGPEVIALSERYVDGELTLDEVGTAIRAMSGL
jgi:hypothetical protein